MENTYEIIFTAQPGMDAVAMNEILQHDAGAKLGKRLSSGVCLAQLQVDYNDFIRDVTNNPTIFIRHINPVHIRHPINGTENPADLAAVLSKFAGYLDKMRTFSIQSRIFSPTKLYEGISINDTLAAALIAQGFVQDSTDPAQILSVVITDEYMYVGLSAPEQNLSNWAGGSIRFMRDGTQVSRAGYKLLEAIDVFHLELPQNGVCLDLGAAPGGWTNILLQKGLKVTAVDPAKLDSSLAGNILLTHEKMTAQQYFISVCDETFDLITNDMKINVDESIDIIISAKPCLRDGGLIIMTLKLGEKSIQKSTYRAITVLRKHFTLLYARQLFHNRSEVTIVLRK